METEQKTPIEWFQQLKEPYRSEAIERIQPEYKDMKYSSLHKAISSFNWFSGIKSFSYWMNMCNSIKAGEITYLETETELKPQDMISGEWYVAFIEFDWIFKFEKYEHKKTFATKKMSLDDKYDYSHQGRYIGGEVLKIRKATREEVLEHFPDEFKDEKKEVDSEYIYFWTDGVYHYPTKDIDLAIENARPESLVYRATPIGTKQTKSILEPIKK
jgi:hypothetical protein